MTFSDLLPILSALTGTLIGGLITFFITRSSLKKQFENQLEIIRLREDKEETIALKSTLSEIVSNQLEVEKIREILIKKNEDELKLTQDANTSLSSESWKKHGDIILTTDKLGEGRNVTIMTFYVNLTKIRDNKYYALNQLNSLIDEAETCKIFIRESLKLKNTIE